MNRILHAAARGARIQKDVSKNIQVHWVVVHVIDLWEIEHLPHLWRIHPDDAHLEYGPVSSALRKAAESGSAWDLTSEAWQMARIALRHEYWYWATPDELHLSLFLLLMAEALADEGL